MKRLIVMLVIVVMFVFSVSASTVLGQPSCDIILTQPNTALFTWEDVQFSTTVDGICNEACFTWEISVQESAGSTINQNGLYTAGGNGGTDIIQVTDLCNGNISNTAIVNVIEPIPYTQEVELSDNFLTGQSSIIYHVDLDVKFSRIYEIEYFFTFGDDALDSEECLMLYPNDVFGGFGFCNGGSIPQTSRLLSPGCSLYRDIDPELCNYLLDGITSGEIQAHDHDYGYPITTSLEITSFTITVFGAQLEYVPIDIKPNPLNLKCQGVLPAELMGTEEFDVTSIDPDSLRLTREGINDGVAPIRYNITDGVTPSHADMLLKFRVPEVVETLMLNELAGQTIPLVLTGQTADGTSIRGQDFVLLLGNVVNECHADFDCDGDVDGSDVVTFKPHYGRSRVTNPCSDTDPCYGDFDKDSDVDGKDAAAFKASYGTVLYWPR